MTVVELLSEYYGLENVTVIQDSVGLVDDNYTVRSNSGSYFFKQFQSISGQEFTALEHTLSTLRAQGIPCPEIVPPLSKLPVSMQHSMLFHYVTGNPYTGTVAQLKSIATLQQRIIELGMPTKITADTQILTKLVATTRNTLQTSGNLHPLTNEHHTIWNYFVETLDEISPALHEFPAPIYLIAMHPDFTERNMLFDETGAVNLICDWQGYGPRILPLELADFLVRFGLKQPFQGVLDQKRLQVIIDTLTQNHSFLDEMIDHYRDHLPTLMILKQITDFPFRVSCYYAGNQPTLMEKIIHWSTEFVQWLARTCDAKSLFTCPDDKSGRL